MPRRPTRTVPTVLIPGWNGSGPGHWQSWLAGQLAAHEREVRWPDLPDVDHPDLARWLVAPSNAVPPVQETILAQGGYLSEQARGLGIADGLAWALRSAASPA